VTEFDSSVKCQQGSGDDRGGVANGQHPVWLEILEKGIEMGEDRRADLCQ
jgi:hypothetical protein